MMCRYKKYRIFAVTIFLIICVTQLPAQKHKKYARQGNRDYEEKDYAGSEMLYRRAVEENPAFDKAVFNLGDALYKQEKFEDAIGSFKKLADKEIDKETIADSYYNLGNSLLKSGKIEESIKAYKESLRKNPGNLEAKYNLAYAQDQLKQQQQQQQQDNQDNQDKQEQSENNQQDNQQDNSENNDDQQQNQQQNQDNKQESQGEQQQQQQQISKEDAERLLQALAENEKEVQEKVKKAKAAAARVRTLKEW